MGSWEVRNFELGHAFWRQTTLILSFLGIALFTNRSKMEQTKSQMLIVQIMGKTLCNWVPLRGCGRLPPQTTDHTFSKCIQLSDADGYTAYAALYWI
jgi:hypothetical protein